MENLFDKEGSTKFYDARYTEGYMEEWEDAKKDKVREIILSLNLPKNGQALDFGCGNGVFTIILKQCLPGWEVYGVEISPTAVANAKQRFPTCHFFHADEATKYHAQFDFLFSHHVIEHVPNLEETFSIINAYLKPQASQLHILPCRNEGSFEYIICELKDDGIEKDKGNRFFFEEPGHLRRLNTKEFEAQESHYGFTLTKEFYANQYHGAVNWITKSSPRFVKKLTSTNNAKDDRSVQKLHSLRKQLLPLTYAQFAYSKYWMLNSKTKKNIRDRIKLTALFVPAMVSKVVFKRVEKASNQEWLKHKTDTNGSEMFLFFKREGL